MSMFGNIEQIAKTVTENTELLQLNLATIIADTTDGSCSDIFKKLSGVLKESTAEFPGTINNWMDEFPDAELLLNDLFKNESSSLLNDSNSKPVDQVPDTTVGRSLDSSSIGKAVGTVGKTVGTAVAKVLDNKPAIGPAIGKAIGTVTAKHHR